MKLTSLFPLVVIPLLSLGGCGSDDVFRASSDQASSDGHGPTDSHLGVSESADAAAYNAPLAGSVAGVPSLIQGSFGNPQQGNFELVVPSSGPGLLHYYRINNVAGVPWGGPVFFGGFPGNVPTTYGSVSLVQAKDQTLELMARSGTSLLFFERSIQGNWSAPRTIALNLDTRTNVAPVMILSQCAGLPGPGNLQVAVPNAVAGIDFYERDSSQSSMPWIKRPTFAQSLGKVDGVAMIEGDYGTPGNFDLVARANGALVGFWRNPCGTSTSVPGWNQIPGALPTPQGISGNPVMIQSRFGATGRDFNLLVPAVGGGVMELERDNSGSNALWSYRTTFATDLGKVTGVSLIESKFGSPGNLEVALTVGNTLWSAYRDSAGWHTAPIAAPVDTLTFPPSPYSASYTDHVDALTGTLPNIQGEPPGAIYGTDLGVSFERNGVLTFLSGDTHPELWNGSGDDTAARKYDPMFDREFYATSHSTSLAGHGGPVLDVSPGVQSYLSIGGLAPANGGASGQLPVEGIALPDATYVFWMANSVLSPNGVGWTPTESVLTKTNGPNGDLAALQQVSVQSSPHFINVSAVAVGSDVFLFGSGPYRKSAVYMARVPAASFANRASWSYFRGTRNGIAQYGLGEDSAMPITDDTTVGELSVRPDPTGGYLMTANLAPPDVPVYGTIGLRWAPNPWGPWSARTPIFVPTEGGYERFMHSLPSDICHTSADGFAYDDGLAENPQRFDCTAVQSAQSAPAVYDANYRCLPQNQLPDYLSCGADGARGSSYAPYMMPRYFATPSSGELDIVYTLSSWNPYQVQVMRTALSRNGALVFRPGYGRGLPKSTLTNGTFATGDLTGWQLVDDVDSAASFWVRTDSGQPTLSTDSWPSMNAGRGHAYQCFQVDETTTSVSFSIRGDGGSVRLHHLASSDCVLPCWPGQGANGGCLGIPAIRESWAESGQKPVKWTIDDLRGEWVEIVVEDESVSGHIEVSGITIR